MADFKYLTAPRPFEILPQPLPGETLPFVPSPGFSVGPPPPPPHIILPPGIQAFRPLRSTFLSFPSIGGIQSASKGAIPPTSGTTQTSSPMSGMMIPLLIGGGILLILLIR